MMKLKIAEYMAYLQCSAHSKCVVEGENVLDAGHLILAGKTVQHLNKIFIYGLCIQSSAINQNPHEIKGELMTIKGNVLKINAMHCSCKAGNSGRCKHISAFLVKCVREDIESLEEISQTDIKCVWSNEKKNTKAKYKPVSVEEMPCYEQKCTRERTSVDNADVLNIYRKQLPNCSFAQHRQGRRDYSTTETYAVEENPIVHSINSEFSEILNNACQSPAMMELFSAKVGSQKKCCDTFLSTFINQNVSEISINMSQRSEQWNDFRKYRITGSHVYEIFTYSKNDWDTKAIKYFFPKKFSNKFVRYGIETEGCAREAFIELTGANIIDCGMVVSHSNEWLGYSPDGIIFENGKPAVLLEIKCLYEGKTASILDVLKNIKYIYKEGTEYKLKTKHKYYGQIQCGMALLNLNKTAFVIFCSYDRSLCVINVEFDYKYTVNMLRVVKEKYFNKMIHVLCEKQKNTEEESVKNSEKENIVNN
uniref:Uncharacterized protein LOC114344070 isoform X1 n=1 Tax=Diabrotica virgifera virgifera TaxID=50390 RepID=A0A6P7H3Y7_DIAVI